MFVDLMKSLRGLDPTASNEKPDEKDVEIASLTQQAETYIVRLNEMHDDIDDYRARMQEIDEDIEALLDLVKSNKAGYI